MVALVLVILIVAASCAPSSVRLSQAGEAQSKFIEYQLAANVVARNQACFETLLREVRAMVEGREGAESEQGFVKKWGLKRFDPNSGFDDALAACVGEPTLKELGIGDNETHLSFLERKRKEWEQAEAGEAGGRSVPR